MKNFKLLALLALAMFIASCAKEREPDRIEDPNNEVVDKGLLKPNNAVWLYKATVVKTSENAGLAFVGYQNDVRAGYFRFTKDKLQLVNANSVYPTESENNSHAVLNQWDVTHFDTKLDERNGKVTNQEVEDDEKSFDQKRFFKIDFSKADVSEVADFSGFGSSCYSNKNGRILQDSLVWSPDYITFVVELNYQVKPQCASNRRWLKSDFTYTMQIRYSFKTREANPNYRPFRYDGGEFDPLHNKYGYFKTLKERINPETGWVDYDHFANRWDPNKDHHFFFAKGFPEEYKWMYTDPEKGVFARTNQALAEKGIKARFYIHENDGLDGKPKEFGDIRYSFINWISEIESGSPLGYGPSDADPFTGELISANSMVWTSSLRYYVKRLRDIENNQQTLAEASLFRKMKRFLGFESDQWKMPMDFTERKSGDIFHRVMMDKTYGLPYWNSFTTVDPQEHSIFTARDSSQIDEMLSHSGHGLHTNFTNFNKGMDKVFVEMDEKMKSEIRDQQRGHCQYPLMEALAGVRGAITKGKTNKEIVDDILYRVAIHEFGHNISLRHNFYGSVDKKNFVDENATSSSVMDYLALEDEIGLEYDWESYDKAAIQYLYSDGTVDSEKFHLFCTDEHRPLNAMCNTWDKGATPTEVIANMIEDYESLYFIRNYRYDRPFWGTQSYANALFGTMWDIKKFLAMWRQDFTSNQLNEYFKNRPDLTLDQKEDIIEDINDQFHHAVKLSLAFYDGVVQQAASDRPWRTQFDNRTGAVTRQGILYDKLFAVRFLIGDEGFMYNPSESFNNISYLSYADIPEIKEYVERAFENSLTTRVDMDTWFLGYSRALYAFNSANFSNSFDNSLVDRIRVVKLSSEQLRDDLGLDLSSLRDTGTFTVETADSPHFNKGAIVGYTNVHGSYYLTEKYRSPYSYNIFQKITESFGDQNINRLKADLVELYRMYLTVR
jgi:uncharacterized protein YuzB (UPF0349 family)